MDCALDARTDERLPIAHVIRGLNNLSVGSGIRCLQRLQITRNPAEIPRVVGRLLAALEAFQHLASLRAHFLAHIHKLGTVPAVARHVRARVLLVTAPHRAQSTLAVALLCCQLLFELHVLSSDVINPLFLVLFKLVVDLVFVSGARTRVQRHSVTSGRHLQGLRE